MNEKQMGESRLLFNADVVEMRLDHPSVEIDNEKPSTITFNIGTQEKLRITKDGFFVDGYAVDVRDPEQHRTIVYEGLISFVRAALKNMNG